MIKADERKVNPVEFGRVLTRARLRSGLSQKRLAARAGLTNSYISRLESGTRHPSIAVLNDLERLLGVTLAESLELRVAAGFISEMESELIVQALSMPGSW